MIKISRKAIVSIIKVLFLSVFIVGVCYIFIPEGWDQFTKSAQPISTGYTDFYIIRFIDNSTGKVTVNLSSGGFGLTSIQYNPIPIVVAVQINESKKNSTTIEAEFPHASISTSNRETPMENRIVSLRYNSIQDYADNSTYSTQSTLSYLYGGQFDIVLHISNEKTRMLEKEFGTKQNTELFTLPSVISIQSADSYRQMQYTQWSFGLSLMILGVSAIIALTVIPNWIDTINDIIPSKKTTNDVIQSNSEAIQISNTQTKINDKEFHADLTNREKELDIKLAKIGMSFGGFVALGAALFALGGEELLQLDISKVFAGLILIVAAIVFTTYGSHWRSKELNLLKSKNNLTPQPEKVKASNRNCLNHIFHCQRYDGIDT